MSFHNKNQLEVIAQIIEVFEDFLEEKGIEIENPEKENVDNESIIYGTDYGDMEYRIKQILEK